MFCCLISPTTKLSGLSINSDPWRLGMSGMRHVQSMMFCTDQIGLEVLKAGVFSCGPAEFQAAYDNSRDEFIMSYEIGLSRQILDKGYEIAALFVPDALEMSTGDVWYNDRYFGSTVNPFETMFVKANRISSSILSLYTKYSMLP